MDAEAAAKVAEICSQADGGCPVCEFEQMALLVKAFPEHDWPVLFARAHVYEEGKEPDQSRIAGYRRSLAEGRAEF